MTTKKIFLGKIKFLETRYPFNFHKIRVLSIVSKPLLFCLLMVNFVISCQYKIGPLKKGHSEITDSGTNQGSDKVPDNMSKENSDGYIDGPAEDSTEWKVAFYDPMTENWEKNWIHDSDADIKNVDEGLKVETNNKHEVVWLKHQMNGDFKIEYDWTSIRKGNNACVMYLLSEGVGNKDPNVLNWSDGRSNGSANHYIKHMKNVRITYSTPQKTVRFKEDPGSSELAEYDDQDIFVTNKTLHFIIERKESDLTFSVIDKETNHVTEFALKGKMPKLNTGHFALRQMKSRDIIYKNFTVSCLKNKNCISGTQ